jgi:hypothetical protein
MARESFLQIRLSADDRDRVHRAATAEHLDDSAFSRRIIMKAVEAWEEEQAAKGKVLGPPTPRSKPDQKGKPSEAPKRTAID